MSVNRSLWSALSTLAQQWSVEDEEEAERERRRKTKGSTTMDPDDTPNDETELQVTSESPAFENNDSSGGGLDQLQMDFVEMLRMRDECRRRRHVETLNSQRKEEEGGDEVREQGGNTGEVQEKLLGETQDDNIQMSTQRCKESLVSSPPSSTDFTLTPVSESGKHRGHGSTNSDHNLITTKELPQTFVSSLSISFDNNPATPAVASSPSSPPSQIQGVNNMMTPIKNGEVKGCQNGSASNFEPADKPTFIRQSSRTKSFRMLKKKEEETSPLQRSASMRAATKIFEPNRGTNEGEGQQSPFQRNSRQRLSSRSIQEKMERLAQASQKWEAIKSPTLAHKTLFLADEVSKKRELFEEQVVSETSLAPSKQDYHTLSAGISDRINRWVQKKSLHSLSSLTPTDLRHVDITSKKMLFERAQKEGHPTTFK